MSIFFHLNSYKYKKLSVFLLFLGVIVLHGLVRISELPYARPVLGVYFFIPSINFAIGRGFTDDNASTYSNEYPPELLNFITSAYNFNQQSGPRTKWLSISSSIHPNKVSAASSRGIIVNADSLGYRYLLGIIWKYFGLNWYYVGLLNYFFSLFALFALMLCAYRVLGPTYSIIIGLIFSIAVPDISFMTNLTRDGMSLWFSCYLLSALILFFSKPTSVKRASVYAISIGSIIYLSVQGKVSNIYFLPLIILIYLFLFSFNNGKDSFRLNKYIKDNFFNKVFFFILCSSLTSLFAIIPQVLSNSYFLEPNHLKSLYHVGFLGLGIWGELTSHPSMVRYCDGYAEYLVLDYGQRVLNYSPKDLGFLTKPYDETIKQLYFLFIKTYPYFFFRYVLWESFRNTLLFLGTKNTLLNCDLALSSPIGKFLGSYSKLMFEEYFLFIMSFIGGLLLWFRLKLKKIAIILGFFAFYNASIAFIQFQPRHLLMGHPVYYFLSGVTLGFIFENYTKKIVDFFIQLLVFSPKLKKISLKTIFIQTISFLNSIISLLLTRRFLIKLVQVLSILIIGGAFIILLKNKIRSIEEDNIHNIQVFVNTLEKKPLEFDPNHITLTNPSSQLTPTIGVYCEIGQVTMPKEVNIKIGNGYKTTIFPVKGKDVIIFIPLYGNFPIQFEDNHQCKAFYWSDLKSWKGFLWEGSYDRSTLQNLK